jgi:hypothetical protein
VGDGELVAATADGDPASNGGPPVEADLAPRVIAPLDPPTETEPPL